MRNLLANREFLARARSLIKSDYFASGEEQVIYDLIDDHVEKYNAPPNAEILKIQIGKADEVSEEEKSTLNSIVDDICGAEPAEIQWILDSTEKWCKDRALHGAIHKAIKIYNGEDKSGVGSIAKAVEDALAISFQVNLGHDWDDDIDERWERYHEPMARIPSNVSIFNEHTKGGWPKKKVNMVVSGTNVGKTLFLCSEAANARLRGFNVVYFSLEMSEADIGKRIDANILDISTDEVDALSKDEFRSLVSAKKGMGKLVIKDYPTITAGAAHFKAFLRELKLKKNGFYPDLVIVDYMGICIPTKVKGGNFESYGHYKAIIEELRSFAVEMDVSVLTAHQLNRTGSKKQADADMEDIADSYGIAMTADFVMVMSRTEELDKLGKVMFRKVKTRYGDATVNTRFLVGINRSKQRLFDTDQPADPDDLLPKTPDEVYADMEKEGTTIDVSDLRGPAKTKSAPEGIVV